MRELQKHRPIDIVIDYLWGHPMELILQAWKGDGGHTDTHRTSIVSVGDMAGKTIKLESESLRSMDIHLLGSGYGSLSQKDLEEFNTTILPEMFQLAAADKLKIAIQRAPLREVTAAWENGSAGQRPVILMDPRLQE